MPPIQPESVDEKVSKSATQLNADAKEALHAEPSKQEAALAKLQTDWQDAQEHGAGFARAVFEKIKSDNSGLGGMTCELNKGKDGRPTSIDFKPSSWDFSETSSKVSSGKANAAEDPYKGTGFDIEDANDRTFYIYEKNSRPTNHAPIYNPMRAAGLGELRPGQETDGYVDNSGATVDSRKSSSTKNADGSVTYNYKGGVEGGIYDQMAKLRTSWADSAKMPGDVASSFSASETIAADGKTILATNIKYDHPKSMLFGGSNGINDRPIEIENVKEITGMRRSDGEYQAKISSTGGYTTFCQIDSNGYVHSMQQFPMGRSGKTQPDWWEVSR